MKKHLFLLPLVLAFAFTAQAQQVALRPGDVIINNISPAGVTTPQYNLNGGPVKRFKNLTWLELEVEYTTNVDNIDELTFDYSIVIGQQLLVGSTTYVDIAKGREHYAVVYVSPHSIAKLLGNKPFTASALGAIQVKVSRQGQQLDLKTKGPAIPNMPQTSGMILNKPETPFAPLYWDRYEAIKPNSR